MSMLSATQTWKPHNYPWAIEFATMHEKMHWGSWELNLQEDVNQWKSGVLTEVDRSHILHILRLFTQSDFTIGDNYIQYFIPVFKNHEIRHALISIANRETEHTRSYAALNDTLNIGDEEYHTFASFAEMKNKLDYMAFNEVSSKKGIALAVAKTVFNEGVALFSAFAMLLNYDRFGKMKGMGEMNSWSLRDESSHAEFMAQVFRTFCDENPRIVNDDLKKAIYDIARETVRLEDHFLDLAYELGEPEGLKKDEVKQYIRFLADRRLQQLGLNPNFGVEENPLEFMEWMLNGDDFTSFFERKVTQYSKEGFSGDDWGYDQIGKLFYNASTCVAGLPGN